MILSKAIMTRSRLRNRYNKWKSKENYLSYQNSKRTCKNLTKATKTLYFIKATENGLMTNKQLWKTFKPLLSNKGMIHSSNIVLKENGTLINDVNKIVEIFNKHYINLAESTMGMALLVVT